MSLCFISLEILYFFTFKVSILVTAKKKKTTAVLQIEVIEVTEERTKQENKATTTSKVVGWVSVNARLYCLVVC